MISLLKRATCALVLFCVSAGFASAQGVQTGDLSGLARDGAGLALPGATVTVESAALQGRRTAVTDETGAFLIRGLPPGPYSVRVEFPDLEPVTRAIVVPLGGTASVDISLPTIRAAETVTVVAETPSLLTRPATSTNLLERDVNLLPVGRTPSLVAEFSPGLTNNTPNANQVTIGGAFAYDSVFLLDGVDINDNLLGRPDDLFIEEAVAETQVLTSGISAEYGRFSGGVVNIVTRRGGNLFSGSFRSNLSNQSWSDETPYEKARNIERPDKMDRYYEGTLGGPIRRDKVWFFLAGRAQSSSSTTPLAQTGIPFETTTDATRLQGKVTVTPAAAQTVQVTYTGRRQDTVQPSLPISIDPNTRDATRQPGSLFVANWNGVLDHRFFATAQVSHKTNHPRFGGTSTAITDSPFLTIGRVAPGGLQYNAPYFDRNDPENRDNLQFTASVSYFASSPRYGSHDVKGGVEHFTSTLQGGNSQSATGYIFNTDFLTSGGRPVIDAAGRLIPVWIPGSSTIGHSIPTRGAQIDVRTLSFYLQDRWTPSARLSLDLGVRYERARSEATGGIVGADEDSWVPRLGATVDLDATGATILGATYAHYAGKYSSYVFGRNTTVANPARVNYVYTGPAGQGRDFAPAFDLGNYTMTTGSFPTANVFLEEGTTSPIGKEITLSLGRELGGRGVVRGVYIWRTTTRIVESFVDDPTAAGKTTVLQNGVTFGVFDNVTWRNSDLPKREYQALQFQGTYRVQPKWSVSGHWTVQLRNHGNFEGEASNQPGIGSPIGDYPEIYVAARNFPEGRLDDYQGHKVRLWSIYTLDFGRFGALDIAPLWRYNSALTYSLAASSVALSAAQRARNPGYSRLPATQPLFFAERGSEEFAGYGLVDLGLTYQVPVWRSLRPWVEVEILNVLNNDKLIGWDTTITVDPSSALDADGLPTGFLRGANFGRDTSASSYPRPRPGLTGGRTFLAAVGVRF